MKLKKAAQTTAYCGRNTRVETIVAMEFAASCKPFRKSKNSATPIRPTSSGKASVGHPSDVLDHDAADLVGDILEAVDDFLQLAVDFAADRLGHGIALAVALEKVLEARVVQLVGAAFDARDLLGKRAKPRHVRADLLEQRDRLGDQVRRLDDHRAHFPHARIETLLLEQRIVFTVLCIMSIASSIDWIRSLMSPRSNGVMKLLRTASSTSRVISSA